MFFWDIDKINNVFVRNSNNLDISLINDNNIFLLEFLTIKKNTKENGIKSLLLYPNNRINDTGTELKLKKNTKYTFKINGFSNISNTGEVYLWIRSKINNMTYDLNNEITYIEKSNSLTTVSMNFTTLNTVRIWFGLYFINEEVGDRFYLSTMELVETDSIPTNKEEKLPSLEETLYDKSIDNSIKEEKLKLFEDSLYDKPINQLNTIRENINKDILLEKSIL